MSGATPIDNLRPCHPSPPSLSSLSSLSGPLLSRLLLSCQHHSSAFQADHARLLLAVQELSEANHRLAGLCAQKERELRAKKEKAALALEVIRERDRTIARLGGEEKEMLLSPESTQQEGFEGERLELEL